MIKYLFMLVAIAITQMALAQPVICRDGGSSCIQSIPFFSEDFSGGIPAGWTNVDLSGNNIVWQMTTVGSFHSYPETDETLGLTGTSAANGYLMIDSDAPGSGTTEDAVLTSPAIDCSGHGSVHLSFNEYFVQFINSTATVLVSNDGVNFFDVYHADIGLSQFESTTNPHYLDIDISSIAANQPAVYVQFYFHGAWDLWWFVDDVQLFEPAASGIDGFSATAFSLDLYPNPAKEVLNIHVGNTPGLTEVNVYNALGQNVYDGILCTASKAIINLAGLHAGVYTVRITSSGSTLTKSFVLSSN